MDAHKKKMMMETINKTVSEKMEPWKDKTAAEIRQELIKVSGRAEEDIEPLTEAAAAFHELECWHKIQEMKPLLRKIFDEKRRGKNVPRPYRVYYKDRPGESPPAIVEGPPKSRPLLVLPRNL